LHHTLETGIPERGKVQEIQGQKMVVHRIPIWKNNKMAGAIGMVIFEGVSELYKILERVNEGQSASYSKVKLSQANKPKKMNFEYIIGESSELSMCKSIARKAAKTLATVMITGESGTGKEMFARSIHELSPYSKGPFVGLNCAAIPEQLLEAELFGFEEGSFTGARRGGKPGKFELAHNGTLFLDEIGDMPLYMQAKILRALQEKEVERVGGTKKNHFHVRLMAATHRCLEDMVKEGLFREDLYYRLNIVQLKIPSLKERKKDIPILLSHYMDFFCEQYNVKPKKFARSAMQVLMDYNWPGNVRELMNTVERIVALSDEEVVKQDELPSGMGNSQQDFVPAKTILQEEPSHLSLMKIDALEREKIMIQTVLNEVKGNKTKAAEKLGIHRSTLYQKLQKLSLSD
jgi:transcriptional regulator with PAS, ATPase and Fis domain